MKNLVTVSIILMLTACQAANLGKPSNEVYGLKVCQAFTGLYQTATQLILDNKLSEDKIAKFEKIKEVAEPYCLAGDFTERATAEYVAGAVVDLVLITKGK